MDLLPSVLRRSLKWPTRAAARLPQMPAEAWAARALRRYRRRRELYVIDVNPNPDMGAGGGFVRQCREGGLDRNDLALHILGLAMNGRPEGEADELDS